MLKLVVIMCILRLLHAGVLARACLAFLLAAKAVGALGTILLLHSALIGFERLEVEETIRQHSGGGAPAAARAADDADLGDAIHVLSELGDALPRPSNATDAADDAEFAAAERAVSLLAVRSGLDGYDSGRAAVNVVEAPLVRRGWRAVQRLRDRWVRRCDVFFKKKKSIKLQAEHGLCDLWVRRCDIFLKNVTQHKKCSDQVEHNLQL